MGGNIRRDIEEIRRAIKEDAERWVRLEGMLSGGKTRNRGESWMVAVNDSESAKRGLLMVSEGGSKLPGPKKIRVKVYFNPKTFQAIAQDAERTGKRRGGLQLFVQRKNGFMDQVDANTDGISKFLKMCWQYWREHEADRLEQAAELKRKEIEIQEQKRKLGIH